MRTEITNDNALKMLQSMSEIKFEEIKKRNLTEIYNRGKSRDKPGSTPFKTGELRISLTYAGDDTVGYTKEYAPHVEFGHRTRGGGYVAGRHYLQTNVDLQRPIFEKDLLDAIKAAAEKN